MSQYVMKSLGFVGLESIQSSIIAGLVTGDPLLLVGAHGSAKTALARALAGALGLKYWAYDSSKALFEDLIGFPDPSKLMSGSIDYVPTPLSIWGKEFILVDEISRAAPSMQNKWLEVIRSRQIMGKPLAQLKYIMAAMNPPGYLGAYPLDAALASRFAFIIEMPEAKNMTEAELKQVIKTITRDDAVMAQKAIMSLPEYKCIESSENTGKNLQEIISKSRECLPWAYQTHGEMVSEYIKLVSKQLQMKEIYLDGRRLGMIHRNFLAVFAVEKVLGTENPDMENVLFRTLLHSLPLKALGMDITNDNFYPCHYLAYQSVFEGNTSCRVILASIVGKSDILEAVDSYAQAIESLEEEDHHEVLNYIIEKFKVAKEEEKHKSLIALIRFLKICWQKNEKVPPAVVARAMEHYGTVTGISALTPDDFDSIIQDEESGFKIDLTDPCENLCLRMAISINRNGRGIHSFLDQDSVKSTYQKIIELIRPVLTRELKK